MPVHIRLARLTLLATAALVAVAVTACQPAANSSSTGLSSATTAGVAAGALAPC